MHHVLAVINPSSGVRQGTQVAHWLSEMAVRRGTHLTIRPTMAGQSAALLVTDASAFNRVIVSGGDGTVMEVLNGLTGSNIPVALVPGGTGNVLAQAIGVHADLRLACEDALADCDTLPMDMGILNDHIHFALRLSVGYEALVTRDTTRAMKSRYGKLAYVMEGVRHALRLQSARYRIDVDGVVLRIRAESVWVANTSALGVLGLQLNTAINLSDRQLDLVIFRFSTIRDLQRLMQAVFRREKLPYMLMTHIPVRQYVNIVASHRQPVQVDGDTVGSTPCRIRVVPAAVQVCRPSHMTFTSLGRQVEMRMPLG